MTEKINLAIDALAAAAFIEGGVSPEKCQAARDLTDQRKRELVAVISAPCLHQIQEPASVQAVQPVICDTCNDHGMIGGLSFYDPGEGGQPCPDCEERHRNSLAAGDLMAWAAEVGGNRIAENVVEMTREDLQRLIAERTPQTAPAAVAVADELAEPTTWMLVEDLVQAECAKNRLHQEYMGKAMPEDVYQRFERLRDERVPALRAQVYARLAATPAPDAQVPQGSYVSTSGELKPDVSVYSTPAAAPVMLPEPDAEIAVLMNRSACQKYPNDINLRIAHNEGWNAARALLATATGLPAQAVEPSDAELIALNAGECFFSESPSKYPELGHGTQYHGGAPGVIGFARAALALRADPAAYSQKFQQRVQPWMMACFGPEISADRIERNHRFLEEALELVQSCGCTASEAHQLVDYVYGRPWGEPAQEAGGVMVTLAALCLANGLDMHACGETELARIWTKVEAIRAKQAAKPKHSPLPMHVAQADAQDAEIKWPKARDVGRIGDMSQVAHIRVGFDSDNDVFVSVWDENGGGSIEFCNPGGGGGGQSSRTRMALIALMVAMEADNAEKPSRDWWAQRAAIAAAKGE